MRRIVVCLLIICIFLSGCSALVGGEHVWTQIHSIPKSPVSNQGITAADYDQLYRAIVDLVESGTVQATISVDRYDRDAIETDANAAIVAVRKENAIAAYAVESIDYTLGTGGGENVLVLEIRYLHGQSEIKKIQTVADTGAAAEVTATALTACDTGIVMQILSYEEKDFVQIVEDYAMTYPEAVMEVPQVTVNVYPETGETRVVELKFTYQTSRESLKNMQSQVANLFRSAELFAGGNRTEKGRFTRLYTWLMETNEYTLTPSITPAYSLLQYGTGDSRAFAIVYASLCRRMGMECLTVSGTRAGESWYWNMVRVDDVYYHLDLLQCSQAGEWMLLRDSQMVDYVWDYNAYPHSPDPEPEPTEPPTTTVTQE